MSGWLKRGYEDGEKKVKEIEAKRANQIYRFWLKPEGTTQVIFLDDDPPYLEEHQLKIDGDWKNWYTSFPKGTTVITKDGVKPIEGITIGDMVLTHLGTFRDVINTHRYPYTGNMVEITCSKLGEPLRATEDHEIFAIKERQVNKTHACRNRMYYKDKELDLMRMDELEVGDYVFVPHATENKEVIRENGYEITPEFAYFLGAYVANGSKLYNRGIEITIGNSNERATKIRRCMEEVFTKIDSIKETEKYCRFFIFDKKLQDFLVNNCGKNTYEKRVPSFIYQCNNDIIKKMFISGYVDGDGYYDANYKVTVSTVSKELAYQVFNILNSLGYFPNIREYEPLEEERKTIYKVEYPHKGTGYKAFQKEGGMLVKVKEIRYEQVKEEYVYCLTVENTNSFTANNIAVSNCHKEINENCPHCLSGDKPAFTAFYTILDCTEWTDKKGTVHKNEKKLLAVKLDTYNKLKRLSKKHKEKGFKTGLIGCHYEVYRSTPKSASTGDTWDYIDRYTAEDMKKLAPKGDIVPFDYAKILAPKTKEEMEVAIHQSENSNDDGILDKKLDTKEVDF